MKNNKAIALAVAAVLLVVGLVGGTLAWLTDKTESVNNTFTVSGIDIELKETKSNFQMIPGYTIEKDPKVKVVEGSEDCWLFVKVEKSSTLETYISYEIADGWTPVAGADGVYARKVMKADTVKEFSVLKGDKVTVKPGVTMAQMEALKADGAVQPTLSFTAYACQLHSTNNTEFSAADAWVNVN